MKRLPLSVRDDEAALESYQQLHEGIPEWMRMGVFRWACRRFHSTRDLEAAEQYFRVGLEWSDAYRSTESGVVQLLVRKGLDLLDYCLGIEDEDYADEDYADYAAELEEILARSGSAWTVGTDHERRWCLTRRVDKTVLEAATEEMDQQGNAAESLRSAWHHVYGRNPNPSTAYHDAVRAVEAAARPLVTPTDEKATLGKMISALQDKPRKWGTVIGDVDTVRKMMETIWKSQLDRHGTDNATKPFNVSQSEAEAAVQMAVTLVQLFRTEAIQRIS